MMEFAGFCFDAGRLELHFRGQRLAMQEQPLRLLGLLLAQPGEIVTRERIQEALWKNKHRDHEHGINTAVRKLRKVLERAKNPELRIVTSAGIGYRILLPPNVASSPEPEQVSTIIDAAEVLEADPIGKEAFLAGRFLFSQRDPRSLFAAKERFELACERMPNFALGHASLSRTCRFLTIFEASDPGPLWQKAEWHAMRAVELDDQSSEAHSSLACVLARYLWRWDEGCAAYERALQLSPNDPETYCDYGVALLAMGRYNEGAHTLERVLMLDPRYAVGRATVALGWLMQGRKKEAVATLTEMTEVMPSFLTPWIYLGIEQLNTMCWKEAEVSFSRTLAIAPENPTFLSLLAQSYAGQQLNDKVQQIVSKLIVVAKTRYVSPTSLVIAYTASGDLPSALDAVTRTVTERDANFALYRKMRALDPIRQTREFTLALKSMNLLE